MIKNLLNYAIFISLSIFIVFGIGEFAIRNMTFSTGSGAGIPNARWFQAFWKPINQEGFRDFQYQLDPSKFQVIFLGDSFTAGHGVSFEETFYYKVSQNLDHKLYQTVNLARNGADSRSELSSLETYLSANKVEKGVLVLQYFGNDIDGYIDMSKIIPKGELGFKKSELLNFIYTYVQMSKFGEDYKKELKYSYGDSSIMNKHLEDVNKIIRLAHKNNLKVVFVVFPFLQSEDDTNMSEIYIIPLEKNFSESCIKGDHFLSVKNLGLDQMPLKERVVNSLDAHPSSSLHEKVGEAILFSLTAKEKSQDYYKNSVKSCVKY